MGGGASLCEGVSSGTESKLLALNSTGCLSLSVSPTRLSPDLVERIGSLCTVDGFFSFHGL